MAEWIGINGDPAIIVVDLARHDAKINWTGIEAIKNGEIFCGKYQSTTLSFPRPQVLVLANVPPMGVGTEISVDRVIGVEIRNFITALRVGNRPPANLDELKAFPSVTLYNRTVNVHRTVNVQQTLLG